MDPEADPQSVFANRGALFVVGSLLDISTQQKAFAQAGNTDEWTILPFPSKIKPVVDVYGPSLMVARSTPPRQVAGWLVIEWLVYPPNQAEWVEALGVYPTRRNSLTYLGGISAASPQWEQSLDLLPLAHSEPTLASWGAMRWSLQDAMLELFNQKYTGALVPSILENLDHLAADVVGQVH